MGRPLECRPAPEPSNVHWMNQGISLERRNGGLILVYITIIVVLIIDFIFVTILESYVIASNSKYPVGLDCNQYRQFDEKMYKKLATLDKMDTLRSKGLGIYQCNCQDSLDLLGYLLGKFSKDEICW